jgi:hypothetical protein
VDKAKVVSEEADTAKVESENALVQAKEAQSHLAESLRLASEAAAKSANAVASASTALDLARGARQEADTFEKRLSFAETKAYEAESHLSQALDRAARAEAEIARLTARFADRSLTDMQVRDMGNILVRFAGQEWDVVAYWDMHECMALTNRIYQVLETARWKHTPPTLWHGLMGGVEGVNVGRHPESDTRVTEAADALVQALNTNGIAAKLEVENAKNNPKHNMIHMSIGTRP